VFEGNGIYLLVALLVTVAILGGYAWSLFSRAADARQDAARRGDDSRA
jgi:hypothetical protein